LKSSRPGTRHVYASRARPEGLKQPLFDRLRQELGKDPDARASEIWVTTLLRDQLGLYTTEVHQKTREEVINRQQADLLEPSTPSSGCGTECSPCPSSARSTAPAPRS